MFAIALTQKKKNHICNKDNSDKHKLAFIWDNTSVFYWVWIQYWKFNNIKFCRENLLSI